MSDSHFDSEITITPPLTWRECRATPVTDDAELRIDEHIEDGDNGQTRVLTGVAIVAKKFAHGFQLPASIQAIIDAHPDHEFTGHIEEWLEVGYRELPRRYAVKDRQVVTVESTWPADEPQLVPEAARQQIAAELEAHAESIGWYEGGGVWAEALDVIRQEPWTRRDAEGDDA